MNSYAHIHISSFPLIGRSKLVLLGGSRDMPELVRWPVRPDFGASGHLLGAARERQSGHTAGGGRVVQRSLSWTRKTDVFG